MDLLAIASALKDPALVAAFVYAGLELRALRRHVGRLFDKVEELEASHADQETRIRILEHQHGVPVASPVRGCPPG